MQYKIDGSVLNQVTADMHLAAAHHSECAKLDVLLAEAAYNLTVNTVDSTCGLQMQKYTR